jgi:hypothetical protein
MGRAALVAVLLFAAGCRTRLAALGDGPTDGGNPPDLSEIIVDLAVPDFAGPDFAVPRDLAIPPDFSIPLDFTVIPDLRPPADLRPPKYCDGIFVFEERNNLYFFDPVKLQFTFIGNLACNNNGASPFSMAVDRNGIAWVEYTNGRLFIVDTYTAQCGPTMYQPGQHGFVNFGMGFAADGPNAQTETLYLARSDFNGMGATPELGSLDTKNLLITDIAPLTGNAELTGTGAGELWGFFATNAPHYGRIDKKTGAVNPDIATPKLGNVTNDAFAFAAFGGFFWVFLAPQGANTTVYKLDPNNGSVTAVANANFIVVGAGVSTCAPQM